MLSVSAELHVFCNVHITATRDRGWLYRLLRSLVLLRFRLVGRDDQQKFCEVCFPREVRPEIGRWRRFLWELRMSLVQFLCLPVTLFRREFSRRPSLLTP